MDRMTALVLAMLLTATPAAAAAQKEVTRAAEAAAFEKMAATIPLGSRVKLQTTAGRRMTATLMAITGEGLIVKRVTRVPEPAVTIAFADLAQLQREQKQGMTIAKALGIGLAAGAGAILTLFAIAVSVAD